MMLLLLFLLPIIAITLLHWTKSKKATRYLTDITSVLSILAVGKLYLDTRLGHALPRLNLAWIDSLGIRIHLAPDGLSLVMMGLTILITSFILLTTFSLDIPKRNVFYALVYLVEFALLGVFSSQNGFVFYVFWELAVIPIYFMIAYWGESNGRSVALRFLIYNLIGSFLMLLGLLYLYNQTPAPHSFNFATLSSMALSAKIQTILFWSLLIAFMIKTPIFPFHSWQPDTYTAANWPTTMLLSGLISKMGLFAMLRILLPTVPLAVTHWAPFAIGVALVSTLYASLVALRQTQFKRLIAYASMAHLGLVAAGILTQNASGIQGSVLQMTAHAVNSVALFFVAQLLFQWVGTHDIPKMGGLGKYAPFLSAAFLVIVLGNVALPLTNGFAGEFLILMGIFKHNYWLAAVATISVVLGAWYMLHAYQGIMLGTPTEARSPLQLSRLNHGLLLLTCLVIFLLGIYPKIVLSLIQYLGCACCN